MRWLKDKLVRNILFSIVGLGLLVGAYYWVQSIPDKKEDGNVTPEQTPTMQSIEIFKYKLEEIKEVYIKNSTDEYTIEKTKIMVKTKDESGAEKSEEKDSWRIKEHKDIEYSAVKLENSVYDFAGVSAEKEITDTANLAQYGLSVPQAKFTLILNDSGSKTILLGNKVVGGEGYFIQEADSKKVYTIPSYKAETMLKKLNDYRDTKLAEVNVQAIQRFTLSSKAGLVADIRPVTEDEKDKFSMLTSFIMTQPKYESVSADNFGKLIQELGVINVASFIEDRPKDLSKFGLDKPSIMFTLSDGEKSYTILYGKRTEDNKIYAMLEGKNFVFTQEIAMFEALSKVETLALLEKFTHIINIEKVADVIVEGQGKKITLSIKGEEDAKTYFANGVSADESAFKKAYQEVIGLTSNGFVKEKIDGAAEYIITFVFKDGATLVNKYISYDERNFALDKNGHMDYIILKKNLSNMMEQLDKFMADPGKKAE